MIGIGGTGGFVAEGLCRLFIGQNVPIILVDYDRVEPHNLRRQNFYPGDEGKFKSQVIAERLARNFQRRIGYSVYPYDSELAGNDNESLVSHLVQGLIIGCVDNAEARQSIATKFQYGNWWIDAGNGDASGQVLIGNSATAEQLDAAFDPTERTVDRLPLPSLQAPSLLVPVARLARDCADEVAADTQSPLINQAMAFLVLQMVKQFLDGTLTWMGAYIDLAAGTLQYVPAEPKTVARMMGLKVDSLMGNKCSLGNRYSLRR